MSDNDRPFPIHDNRLAKAKFPDGCRDRIDGAIIVAGIIGVEFDLLDLAKFHVAWLSPFSVGLISSKHPQPAWVLSHLDEL